jgi:hypothetical protein
MKFLLPIVANLIFKALFYSFPKDLPSLQLAHTRRTSGQGLGTFKPRKLYVLPSRIKYSYSLNLPLLQFFSLSPNIFLTLKYIIIIAYSLSGSQSVIAFRWRHEVVRKEHEAVRNVPIF